MPSKTSYFNGTLFRKNLSRYWPLWGMASFSGAMLPLSMLVSQLKESVAIEPAEMKYLYYSVLTYGVPVLSFLYAGLCAMAVWNYLYTARSVGLMHTLPIRREGLFFTGVLSGLVMMAIPYAVTGVLTVLVTVLWGGFEPVSVLVTVLGVAGDSLLFFGFATFCAFVVGNIFSLPALYILLNFLAVLLEWTMAMLTAGFCFGLTGGYYSATVEFLSPLVYLLRKVGVRFSFENMTAADSFGGTRVISSVRLEGGWIIAVYAGVGLLFLVLSFFLYRSRRSESAGDVVSAPWMRPIFRFCYSGLAAVLGGRLLYALLWESFQETQYFEIVPIALCMMVCAAMGYLSTNMALAKSPRVWKQSWRGMLAAAGCCVVFCLGMQWDVLGMERRVPAAERIDTVNLSVAGTEFYLYAGSDDALIGELLGIHGAIAADKAHVLDTLRAGVLVRMDVTVEEASGDGVYGEDLAFTAMDLTYRLKNGRTVRRSYELPIQRDRLSQPDTYDARLDAFVNSVAMRQKRIRWRDARSKLEKAELSTPMLGWGETLSSRQYAALADALAEDAAAGRWGVHDWFAPQGADGDAYYPIYLSMEFSDPTITWGNQIAFRTTRYVQVDAGMTATLAALREMGLLMEQDLVPEKVYRPWDYAEDEAAADAEYARFVETFEMRPEEYYRQNGGQYPEGWFDGTGAGWSDAA